jgi:hypothetical protein
VTIRAIPLLSGYSTSNMTSPYVGPEMPRNLQSALVIVTVESISGGPATATITPKLQVWHSHVGTNQEEVILGGTGSSPLDTWFDITAAGNPSLLPDGNFPTALDVSAAVLAVPISTFKTISGGFPWRLNLAWALTGGTTPSMKISAMAYCSELPSPGFDRVESGS